MALYLILSTDDEKRSNKLYDIIAQHEKKHVPTILFVPDFSRFFSEQEYLKYTGKKAIVDTKITTLSRFIDSVLDLDKDIDTKNFLPSIAKDMVIKRYIQDNKDKFKVFSKVIDQKGFSDKLCDIIDKINKNGLTMDILNQKYSNNDLLKAKILELVTVTEAINEEYRQRFELAEDKKDYFVQKLNDSNYCGISKDTIFFFDGYNNFEMKDYRIIESLLSLGLNIYISIDLDLKQYEESKYEIFNGSYDTYLKLCKIAKKINQQTFLINTIKDEDECALDYLKQNVFNTFASKYEGDSKDVSIKLCATPLDEIRKIAHDITYNVKVKGYRYKDYSIFFNDEVYVDYIIRVFQEYNIPVYLKNGNTINNSSIVVFLSALFDYVYKTENTIDQIIALLKTGLTKFDLNEVCQFDNYVKEFGIKSYMLIKEFTKNSGEQDYAYDLELVNSIRKYIVEQGVIVKKNISSMKSSINITKAIYEYLTSTGILDKYMQELYRVKDISDEEYRKKKQVLSIIYELMDMMNVAFDEIDAKTYIDILLFAISKQTVDTIPSTLDQVEAHDINGFSLQPRKKVYIVGAYEGGLPTIYQSDNLLTDKDISKLNTFDIDICKSSTERNEIAKFNIYKAIKQAKEELQISLPSIKITGENLLPGALVYEIKQLLDVDIISDDGDKQAISKNEAFDLLAFDGEKKYEKYFAQSHSIERQVLEYSRKQEILLKETIEKVYKNDIYTSVSKLEKFKICPFNYFSTYILRLKEKKEYKLNRLDLGNIMHEVLEKVSIYIMAHKITFEEVVNGQKQESVVKEINRVIDNLFESKYGKYNENQRCVVSKQILKSKMKKIYISMAESFLQSEFRPLGYEITFDNDSIFAPIEINLDDGHKLLLTGKIDRIDVAKINNKSYLRIVDYKSSKRELKLSDVKEGVSLQLMTYMAALINNKDKISKETEVLPASIAYFNLNKDVVSIPEYTDQEKIKSKIIKELKLKGIYISDVEILKALDNKFEKSDQSYIDISTRSINNKEKALSEEEFKSECNNMENLLKQIGQDMLKGNVSVCKKNSENCQYCKYGSICRKNTKS